MLSDAQINNIPDVLKVADQWLVWRREKPRRHGGEEQAEEPKDQAEVKPTKVPYDAKLTPTWQKAGSTQPLTWSSFDQAAKRLQTHSRTPEKLRQDEEAETSRVYMDGIGRVLTLDDGLVAWDFDHCLDPETGEIRPDVLEKVNILDSYTEVSPSGDGLRVFTRGTLPWKANKNGNYEAYVTGRYVTVTGNHREGTLLTIEDRQEAINKVHSDIFGPEPDKKVISEFTRPVIPAIGDDADLLNIARAAKNGDKFKRLYDDGDITGYPSRSEARLALTSLLAFYCGPDRERIDRLYRASALMEDKWDSKRVNTGIGDGWTHPHEFTTLAVRPYAPACTRKARVTVWANASDTSLYAPQTPRCILPSVKGANAYWGNPLDRTEINLLSELLLARLLPLVGILRLGGTVDLYGLHYDAEGERAIVAGFAVGLPLQSYKGLPLVRPGENRTGRRVWVPNAPLVSVLREAVYDPSPDAEARIERWHSLTRVLRWLGEEKPEFYPEYFAEHGLALPPGADQHLGELVAAEHQRFDKR